MQRSLNTGSAIEPWQLEWQDYYRALGIRHWTPSRNVRRLCKKRHKQLSKLGVAHD